MCKIGWCEAIDTCLGQEKPVEAIQEELKLTVRTLSTLADQVLQNLDAITRKKFEQLITEMVHQRDVCRRVPGE
jgi:dynein heavy chain 1